MGMLVQIQQGILSHWIKLFRYCIILYNFISIIIRLIKQMSEKDKDTSLSPLKNRQITHSLNKLNKAASQGRFRIKSLRVKTMQTQQQKQKYQQTDRNYQSQLLSKKYNKQFLKSLYIVRSQQSQLKISQIKYLTFIKALHGRIYQTINLNLSACNFQRKSADMFLNQFINVNQDVISYDISKCTYIPSYEQYQQFQDKTINNTSNSKPKWIIQKIIREDKRIVKLLAKNMGFMSIDMKKIFDLVIQTQKIYQLDLSNQNSQSMNRFTQQLDILYDFLKLNPTVSILGLDNLNLRKIGVQQIQKGIAVNMNNPLKILSLKNNGISQQASLHISMLARSGLVELDISENPLSPAFYLSLPSWKPSTIRKLNISMTQMNSQSLIFFLSRIEQNKSLQYLKADNNDFSHHWFNQTKQMLQVNTSIQYLSLVDCKINRLCQTFSGLITNRYMKKINLSCNYFSEGIKQLCEMLKINKVITEIKLKFCGIKKESFIKIFQSLLQNDKIISLDISQNQVGQQGAKQILKTLNSNNTISYLSFQKAQIPFRVRQQIQSKIMTNRELKKQKQISILKKQNKIVKQLDVHTWDQVQQLQLKIKANNKIIASYQSKVNGLEKQYEQRKHRLNQILRQCKEKQGQLSDNFNKLAKKMRELETEEENITKKYKIRSQSLYEAIHKQTNSIQNLQQMIKEQALKNQKRQRQLEDQYENYKYIQKKKQQKKVTVVKKAGFDTSTALNTKRKSGNN